MAAPVASRPTVTVYNAAGAASGSAALPAVFTAPIRKDVVHFVHANIAKNRRQAYAVSQHAGEQTSAISWGTGRAVARIPRVGGGGTHRSGQGAFGNMCRKGRMFAPTKIWRRWHRHVNVNQRRYAIVSALAASAVPALVLARGHRIERLPEVPLVVAGLTAVSKTKQAVEVLKKLGAQADVDRAAHGKKVRAGRGKARNRRFVSRRGPLVIHTNAEAATAGRAFRNLPGTDLANVDRLNLLQLAPGGHMGRFCIWTESAFARLNELYGTVDTAAAAKTGYKLPRLQMANADLASIINSTAIQSVVRPAVKPRVWARHRPNPLTNKAAMRKLNPYVALLKKSEKKAAVVAKDAKSKAEAKRRRAASKSFYSKITNNEAYEA